MSDPQRPDQPPGALPAEMASERQTAGQPSPLSSKSSPAGTPLPPPDPQARRTRPMPVSLVHQAQDFAGKVLGRPPRTIRGLQNNVVWRDVNVLEELDYAVTLGVLSMPAVAVNGALKFSSLPTPEQLRAALISLAPS